MRILSKRKSCKKNRTSVRCSRKRIKGRDSRTKKRYPRHPKFRSSSPLRKYAESLEQQTDEWEKLRNILRNTLSELCDELENPTRSTERVELLKENIRKLSSGYIDKLLETFGNEKYVMKKNH